jgi:uncharacterized protein (TIGR02145 family)
MKWTTWIIVICCAFAALAPAAVGAGEAQSDSGTFEDPRDGQVYKWVSIGNQVWLAENLRFATDSGSWCWENDEAECPTRGRYYNWDTAQRVAPPGWHLPSDEEWMRLEIALGLTRDQAAAEGDRAVENGVLAGKIKAVGAWPTEYEGNIVPVTNANGFSAVPAGLYGLGEFSHDGYTGWWTSSGAGDEAWIRHLRFFDDKISRILNNKAHGFSVRCVKDSDK